MKAEFPFVVELQKKITQEGKEITFNKGDFLTQAGETERYAYFVVSGAIKVYYLTEYEEFIIRLGYDGSFINSLSSFLQERPSELYLEAIRKTKVLRLSKEKVLQVVNHSPETKWSYALFLETLLMQQLDREIDVLLTSPSERLERVLARSPKLF